MERDIITFLYNTSYKDFLIEVVDQTEVNPVLIVKDTKSDNVYAKIITNQNMSEFIDIVIYKDADEQFKQFLEKKIVNYQMYAFNINKVIEFIEGLFEDLVCQREDCVVRFYRNNILFGHINYSFNYITFYFPLAEDFQLEQIKSFSYFLRDKIIVSPKGIISDTKKIEEA